MRWLVVILLSLFALGATVEVRTSLGFPIANATVCAATQCVVTNATGYAEVPAGPVEVYVDGVLVWKTHAAGHDVAIVTYLDSLDVKPLPISGRLLVKLVKLVNGTYVDLEIPFVNNTLVKPMPVGNINYQLEIYIEKIENYVLEKPLRITATIWQPEVDLASLGLVKTCQIRGVPPIGMVTLYSDTSIAARGVNITAYLITELNYTGVADTEIYLPNGTRYRHQFKPAEFCNKTLGVNASRLVIRVVDSFGAVRTDWTIAVASNIYRGQAELWVLPGVIYTVSVDAGFTKKIFTVATRHPSEVLIVEVENAYLLLEYQQPPRRVYIIGNYTVAEAMPRRVELPPGNYTIVAELGGRNLTYHISLTPGQTLKLVIGQAAVETAAETAATGPTYIFIIAVLSIAVVAVFILLRATPRRRQPARGQSRS